MTKLLLAILFALPLAFVVGCGEPCDSDSDAECVGDDDTATPDEFEATLRSVAPYGWVGDHYVWPVDDHLPDPACEDVGQCDTAVADIGNWNIAILGDTFDCVPQIKAVVETNNGTTVDVTSPWMGEGVCGLAPDDDYSGLNVWTNIGDLDEDGTDEVIIYIDSWESIVTGDTFYYEGEDYLLSGTIASDLSTITFHLEWGDDQVEDRTINLED